MVAVRPVVAIIGLLGLAISPAHAEMPRSAAVLREFQKTHPCPSTGLRQGACPGWQKDHLIALECGGPDTVENLHWLTVEDHKAKTLEDNARCRKH